MEQSLGIVIPAYKPNLDVLRTYVASIQSTLEPAEIRIEADAVHQDKIATLQELQVTINTVSERRGKGAAITNGFNHLDTDVLAFADADGSTSAESLMEITDSVGCNNIGLAIGSRRHPDATIIGHQTRIRRWLGHVFALTARAVLDVKLYDYQCGAKAIAQETWQMVREHLVATGFAWDIELIALTSALGYSVKEIPITWEDQPESTVPTVSTSVDLARTLIRTRHRAKVITNRQDHSMLDKPSSSQYEQSHRNQ